MLIIYTSLELGGIQTFLVRLAKERFNSGLPTKILLLCPHHEGQQELTAEIGKYAKIFFTNDIFIGLSRSMNTFGLIAPINAKALSNMLEGIEHIHVATGYHALIARRFNQKAKKNIAISVGFYHSLEFCWGSAKLPYHEKTNRNFIFNCIPKPNLLTFSETIQEFYKNRKFNISGSSTFRIGVIDSSESHHTKKYTSSDTLRIVSIGRLVDFKTYNLWMLDVVYHLRRKNINLHYDIYGDGPLKEAILNKIDLLDLSHYVCLKGNVNYSNLNDTLINYDLFIGSGTAIIEAASAGVCSIVGIESSITDLTYGFFSSVYKIDYNISETDKEKISTTQLIEEFYMMSTVEKQSLSTAHISASKEFDMHTCSENFHKLDNANSDFKEIKFSPVLYTIDYYRFKLLSRFDSTSSLNTKYLNPNKS